MHRATSDDDFTQAWFDDGRSVFPQYVRKTGTNVQRTSVAFFSKTCMGSHNRKSESRKPENKPVAQSEKHNVTDVSLLKGFEEITARM